MELYRRTRVPSRIFLSIFFDVSNIDQVPAIKERIIDSIKRMSGVENYTYSKGTNIIAVTAHWTESEAESRVAELMRIPGVLDVQANVIEHGFAGPRIRP